MGLRVLLADTSALTRKIIHASLEKIGIEVIHDCLDSDTVLEFVEQDMGFSVLFLDVNMPGLDCMTLVSKMREQKWLEKLTIFIISSKLADSDHQLLRGSGVRFFIERPFNVNKFEDIAFPILRGLLHKLDKNSFSHEYQEEILAILKSNQAKIKIQEKEGLFFIKSNNKRLKFSLKLLLENATLERVL